MYVERTPKWRSPASRGTSTLAGSVRASTAIFRLFRGQYLHVTSCSRSETYHRSRRQRKTHERCVVSYLRMLAIVNVVIWFNGSRDSPAYTPGWTHSLGDLVLRLILDCKKRTAFSRCRASPRNFALRGRLGPHWRYWICCARQKKSGFAGRSLASTADR